MNKELFYQYWMGRGIPLIEGGTVGFILEGVDLWNYTARKIKEKNETLTSNQEVAH